MKIEKVNDHQIKCTLTSADLANRELKISELAYGSEKAKTLFRDMMQQAAFEFGFEAENIPLMIEAIPIGADSIILIITKVEDPEEIDTRFSKFAPSVSEDDYDNDSSLAEDIADEVLDLFHHIEASAKKHSAPEKPQTKDPEPAFPRLVVSDSLDHLCTLARNIAPFYTEHNTLFKNPADNSYVLLLTKGGLTLEEFGRICNISSEYGRIEKADAPKEAYIREHYSEVIGCDAVNSLASV
nr:adaptor protein MecA [Lachnospiraceae bacterium]